jgi:hypothetical protein
MSEFEYKVHGRQITEYRAYDEYCLNLFGKEGWELVTIIEGTEIAAPKWIFKRQIEKIEESENLISSWCQCPECMKKKFE